MFKNKKDNQDTYIFIKETCDRVFRKRYGIFNQDVISDAMASIILQYRKNVNEIKSLEGWIVGAIHYHYVAFVNRKDKENKFTFDELILDNIAEDSYPHTKLETDEIFNEIDSLPSPEKDIIKMRIIDGLSYLEISEQLNLKTATARKKFERGILRVKKALQIVSLFLGCYYGA